MKYETYPKYRKSTLEWVDLIPSEWKEVALKRLSKGDRTSFVDGDWIESPYITDDGIRLIQTGNIGVGKYREQGYRYISEGTFREFDCTEVFTDDILICRLADPVGRACLAPDLGKRMITSVDVCILKPEAIHNSKYLTYLLSNDAYLSWISAISRGSTRDRISRSMLGNIKVPVAAPGEQRAIAAFLDRETAKIDALIEKKERLIELLEEKRAALITHAVTKGLDPDPPMKDSGVEWLGKIPEHWEVVRLKHVAKLESGHTPARTNPEYWIECSIPWITLNDVGYLKSHDEITDTENKINELGLSNSSARILPAGTVVLSRDATVGEAGIMGRPMATSQHFVNWVCGERLHNRYLLYLLKGPMQLEFDRLTMGATLRTLGMPEVKSLVVPLPSLTEQVRIVDSILRRDAHLIHSIQAFDRLGDLFQEYRTALISAAVTGRIDVRGEVDLDDII